MVLNRIEIFLYYSLNLRSPECTDWVSEKMEQEQMQMNERLEVEDELRELITTTIRLECELEAVISSRS